MKSSLFSLLLISCSLFCVSAQLDNLHWQEVEYHDDSGDPSGEAKIIMNYWISGDTVFKGKAYKKLYRECVYQDSAEFHNDGLIYRYGISFRLGIREDEQGRIYISDNVSYPTELLLYDFSDWDIGDTLFLNRGGDNITPTIITVNNLDSILLLDGSYAKSFSGFDQLKLINGIGFTNGFLFPIAPYPGSILRSLIFRFYKGDRLLWENPKYVDLNNLRNNMVVRTYSAKNILNFNLPFNFNQLELYSLDGSLLYKCYNQGNTKIQIGPISNGVYLFKVNDTNGSAIIRGKTIVR
ncbi:MAG TPA: T9SS type A sorting domain-containing protein [Bacteroidales bacterium]|nr:T9SS type A sorting domain-containing protein [Bacteroidales bacterium]